MLLCLNSTVLFAQTGDTIQCYTQTELEHIAIRVVRANECDSLLNIAEQRIVVLDTALNALKNNIRFKDSVIVEKDISLELKEGIITEKNLEIISLNNTLDKEKLKRKWLSVGWISTSAIFTGILTFFMIK